MYKKPELSIKEKEARRPKSLRITGLDAPKRQIMSESGRMRLEARKLRKAGDEKGYMIMMRRSAMERLAGEPTVKSQAFVDAQEEAKANQPDMGARMQDMMDDFMRNRRRPEEEGDVQDFGDLPEIRPRDPKYDTWKGPYSLPDIMTSDFRRSETGSGLDARRDPNSASYWGRTRT